MVKVIPNQIVMGYEPEEYLFGDVSPDQAARDNLYRALNAAIMTVRGAVGADVDALLPYDPRVKELVFIYMDDLYSNRGLSAKVGNATRQAVATMELQLKMELRGLRAGGGAVV